VRQSIVADFKYAVFMFESAAVPEDLKVIRAIRDAFRVLPAAAPTLVQAAYLLEDAAHLIDQFKVQTCGSAYSLAIINLNMMNDVKEVDFLLRGDVLGNPRTIFLTSLKYMVGEAYGRARDKIQSESATPGLSSSCLDCYSAGNRNDVPQRIAELAHAYLREAEELEKSRRSGVYSMADPSASQILQKSQTAFFGKKMKSGVFKAASSISSARIRGLEAPPPPSGGV
jgi:hypothetical protein